MLVILFLGIVVLNAVSTVLGHPATQASGYDDGRILGFLKTKPELVKYLLYTPDHPKEVCYIELDKEDNCSLNPAYETKILIHGYTVELRPGNLFEQIKDAFLKNNKFNVIIVDWTRYNRKPYVWACSKAYDVGNAIGKMINSLRLGRRVRSQDIHIIGHSLGAHVAGAAAPMIPNLGRITGLDPAGPFYEYWSSMLSDTSAQLVDVIHTTENLGFSKPIGTIDFYPNGGKVQPACKMGKTFSNSDGGLEKIARYTQVEACSHNIALVYFMNSIELCNFIGTQCPNYEMYLNGSCNSFTSITSLMGHFCATISGLPSKSTFYLNTTENSPYC